MKGILLLLFVFSQRDVWTQTPIHSIFVEYGYVNLPKGHPLIDAMFGHVRYQYYMDENFIKIETLQDLPSEPIKQPGLKLNYAYILDRGTQTIYVCTTLDTVKLRMSKSEPKDLDYKALKEEIFAATNIEIYGRGSQNTSILGWETTEFLTIGMNGDSASLFVYSGMNFPAHLKAFPWYLNQDDSGIILGRIDTLGNGKPLEFRALNMELDKPRPIEMELNSFQLVSKEAGELAIKNWHNQQRQLNSEGKN